jgi:hypothetical protein
MTTLVDSIIRSRSWLAKKSNLWLKPLIILAILLLSIALPVNSTQSQLEMILFMISAVIGVLVLLRWPFAGLVIIMVGSSFVPYSGPGGVNITILGVSFLLGLWLLDMLVRQRRIEFVNSRVLIPACIFLLISILALISGQIQWYVFAQQAPLDAQLGGAAIYIFSVGALLLTAHVIKSQRDLKWLVWLLFAIGFLVVSAQIFRQRFILHRFQPSSFGSMFVTWLVALTFSQALLNRNMHPIGRVASAFLVMGAMYVVYVILGDWKSGWVPPLAAIGAILFLKYPRRMIIFVPPIALLGWYLVGQAISSEQYSWSTRLEAWSILIDIIKANPILGLGFANYYRYTALIPIRGFFVPINSHNQYIDLIAQTGLAGLFCFLWIFLELGRLGWRLRERLPEGFSIAYVYGVLGGLVGTLVSGLLGDWVLPFVYNVGMRGFRASVVGWLFLGGLVALEQIYSRPILEAEV